MEKAIARLGRQNHMNNLISKLPLLTVVYGLQCFMITKLELGINLGEFAFLMAMTLILFVGGLFVYDNYQHVLLYSDHILIYFEPLNTAQRIKYQDIAEIITPTDECDFSSIVFKLTSGKQVVIHFVDYPLQVKHVINEIKNGNLNPIEEKKAA